MVVMMVVWWMLYVQLKHWQIPQERDCILHFSIRSLGKGSVSLQANQYGYLRNLVLMMYQSVLLHISSDPAVTQNS